MTARDSEHYCINCYWDLICLPYRKGYSEAGAAKFQPEDATCYIDNDAGIKRSAAWRGETT